MKIICLIGFVLGVSHYSFSQTTKQNYPVNEAQASALVQQVLLTSPVIDGHNDLFIHYMDCKTCPRDFTSHRLDTLNAGHTDIPRLRKGHAGALLLNIFGEDKSEKSYLDAWALLHRIEKEHAADLKIVATSGEMRAAIKAGKIALLPTLEGATRLQNSTALLEKYYKLGLRSVTFAYRTNGLADGSDDTVRHNGISEAGREMISAMNRLGVLIDMSHISAKAMHDILDVTQAPVIFSHSNIRALCDVNRNVADDVLLRLKKNNGLIMLTFVPYFVKLEHERWLQAGDSVYYKTTKEYKGDSLKMDSVFSVWDKHNPEPVITIADMADHFDYAKKLIGVNHIGMAGDFDGIQFTIQGLEDVSKYPALLKELAMRGWTAQELKKISGENFLRVFGDVERKASALQQVKNK